MHTCVPQSDARACEMYTFVHTLSFFPHWTTFFPVPYHPLFHTLYLFPTTFFPYPSYLFPYPYPQG